MKRFLSISAMLIAVIAIVACLSSCEFVSKTSGEADHDHVLSEWETVKEPSCSEDGQKVKKCSLCDYTETEAIPATKQHTYSTEGKIAKAATCMQSGLKKFYCTAKNCSEYRSEEYNLEVIDADTLYNDIKESVVIVETLDKKNRELNTGMGFVYDVGGKIITNYSIIKGAYSITVKVGGTTFGVASIAAYDEERDLAILELSADFSIQPVKICTETMNDGSVVYIIGTGDGMYEVFSNGKMIDSDAKIGEIGVIEHDARSIYDIAGAPLINAYGEVVGINAPNKYDEGYAVRSIELNNLENTTPITVEEFYMLTNDFSEDIIQWLLGNYNDCLDSEFRYDVEEGDAIYSLVYDELSGKLSLDVFSTLEDGSELYCSVALGSDPTKYAYTASRTKGSDSNLTKGTINATTFTSSTAIAASSFEGDHWNKNDTLKIYQGAIVDTVRWFKSVLAGSNLSTDISDLGFAVFK